MDDDFENELVPTPTPVPDQHAYRPVEFCPGKGLGASLTGPAIREAIDSGVFSAGWLDENGVAIPGFDVDQIGPCSVDLCLGPIILRLKSATVDTHFEPEFERVPVTRQSDGQPFVLLEPGEFYLCHTMERVTLDGVRGVVFGRSSTARYGLTVESAGFVDDGWDGQLTLEVKVERPTWLYIGDRICQMELITLYGTRAPYRGRYNGSVGPVTPKTLGGRGHAS